MTTIDALLRAHDPGAATPDYSDAERRSILSGIVAPAKPSPRHRGWRIGTVAAAILAVAGLGLGTLAGPDPTARAEEILTTAAINAADPPAGPDQYWEVTATHDYGGNDACGGNFTVTLYLSVDGNRPSWHVESYEAVPGCPPAGEDWAWTPERSPNEMADSWRWPSPAFLASLPRDVEQLRARLYADAEGVSTGSIDAGVFVLVGYALTYGSPPADLRSAMFEVLATVPGIQVGGEMVVDGRTVALFTLQGEEVMEMLVIDPEAGDLVGFQGVESERKVTYERRVVDEVPEEIRAVAAVRDCEISFDATGHPAGDLVCE